MWGKFKRPAMMILKSSIKTSIIMCFIFVVGGGGGEVQNKD